MLIVALVVCAFFTRKSKRSIADDVRLLLLALLPPMIGNLDLIVSGDWLVSQIGCYVYFIGLDFSVLALLRFTFHYCDLPYFGTKLRIFFNSIIAIDVIQLLLNPITGHAFDIVGVLFEGGLYYMLVPLAGQVFHRIVAYGVFFVSVFIFGYKTFTSSRIYIEKYLVIFLSMVFVGLWETYYIFSGTPIDRSMIGFGVFGLLVFYFALHYKPMRLLDRMLARVVSGMQAGIFFFDTNGKCIYGNERALSFIDVDSHEEMPDDISRRIEKAIGGWGGSYNENWHVLKRVSSSNEDMFLEVSTQQVHDDRNRHVGTSLSVRDVTEEQRRLNLEKHHATHDELTGLFNKRHLLDCARKLIDENPDVDYKVVAVDIKDFKLINDIFDKEYGDEVLCSIADSLRAHDGPGRVCGRLTGDKFGFVLPASEFSEEEMEQELRGHSAGGAAKNYPIVIHMGVYDVTERDLLISVMFDRAFMAIASIKNDYNNHVATYDDAMRKDLIWRRSISSQLDRAMKQGEIQPYLQPMVDKEGTIEGAEVLVRWIHPDEGFLSPARFIPVFEQNGMIAKLDVFMWEHACKILQSWQNRGIDLFLSVNISPKDFYFINVYETITGLVDKYHIDPSRLRLEITETVMMTDLENRLRILETLRSDGFLVEMDDFGSGYSSLNMLKDIPVDVLKIDMMFLYKTKDQSKAQTILQTIINLSGQLGIPSITEGVETADQLDMLVNMGCRLFQGYYFAKPMPVADFENMVIAA